MKNKLIVRDRLTRKPSVFKGEVNTKRSVTIPGQDITPSEIMRLYARERPKPFYSDLNLHEIRSMNIMDKMDFLRNLEQESAQNREILQTQLKEAKKHQQKLSTEPSSRFQPDLNQPLPEPE